MYVPQCAHAEYGRPLQVNEFSAHASPVRGVQSIACPHCGGHYEGENAYVYLTHPLSGLKENFSKQIAR